MNTVFTSTARSRRSSPALWAGVLGSPIVWAIQQEAGYVLAPWACHHGHLILHLITLACLLLVAIGGLVSWRDYRSSGGGSPDATDGGPIARSRFLGVLGVIVSAMFFMLIFAQGIPSFFFNACWD